MVSRMALINNTTLSYSSNYDDVSHVVTRCISFAITAYIRMHAKYFNAPCSHRYIEFDVQFEKMHAKKKRFLIHVLNVPPSFVESKCDNRRICNESELCLSEVGESFMSEVSSVAESIVVGFLPDYDEDVPCVVSERCWKYHTDISKEEKVSFILDAYTATEALVNV